MYLAAEGYWPGSDAWGSPSGNVGQPQEGWNIPSPGPREKAPLDDLSSSLFPFDDRSSIDRLDDIASACEPVLAACHRDPEGVMLWRDDGGSSAVPLILTVLTTVSVSLSDSSLQLKALQTLDSASMSLALLSNSSNGGGNRDIASVRLDILSGGLFVGVEAICCDALVCAAKLALVEPECPRVLKGVLALLKCAVSSGVSSSTRFFTRDKRLLTLLSQILQLYDIASLTRELRIKLPLSKATVNGYVKVTPSRRALARSFCDAVEPLPTLPHVNRPLPTKGDAGRQGGGRGAVVSRSLFAQPLSLDMEVVSATVSMMFIVLEQQDATTCSQEAGREILSKLSPKGNFGILRPLTEIMKHCRHDEMAANGAKCDEETSRRAYSQLRRESCTLILRLASLSVVAAQRIWETSGALAHLSKAVNKEFSDDDKSIAKHNSAAQKSFAVCAEAMRASKAEKVAARMSLPRGLPPRTAPPSPHFKRGVGGAAEKNRCETQIFPTPQHTSPPPSSTASKLRPSSAPLGGKRSSKSPLHWSAGTTTTQLQATANLTPPLSGGRAYDSRKKGSLAAWR